MPTHLHIIVMPLDRTIGNLLQNFGSFTAHTILEKLQVESRKDLLHFFHAHRRDNSVEHSIWQDIQAKNIYTEKFLLQKIEYIHQNPVAKGWELAQDRAAGQSHLKYEKIAMSKKEAHSDEKPTDSQPD